MKPNPKRPKPAAKDWQAPIDPTPFLERKTEEQTEQRKHKQ